MIVRLLPLLALLAMSAVVPTASADVRPGSFSKVKVKPGESHTNSDGVTVDNDSESSGMATVDPKDGSPSSSTDVNTQTDFIGDISGIDGNDNVHLGSSNTANVSGTGGQVSVSGGSTVNVTNTGPAGGASIEVTLPSGTTIIVPPGPNPVTIHT